MNLTVVIVDDEPDAHKLLEYYCHKHGRISIIGHFYEAVSALAFLEENPPMLVFLDINIPGMSGLQLASLLGNGPQVVFTTAHGQHALEGYEYNTVDYLLKPIKYERFAKALTKVKGPMADGTPTVPETPLQFNGHPQPIVAVHILYAEAMGNYMKLHLHNKKTLVVHETMKHLEQVLKPYSFVRCHKTFLVQTAMVQRMEHDCCFLQNGTTVPIGISYRQQVRAALGGD
jgi:DNA-binding LytR/AlgR family response regulator